MNTNKKKGENERTKKIVYSVPALNTKRLSFF